MTDGITFAQFSRNMYNEAMSERRAHMEKEISYEEYLVTNLDFVYDKFQIWNVHND